MYFLQPIWLAAMAGIVVPVVVHFWNDRRGKVLRIGSIALLEGASQRMAWSRRLSQWWLLLLRCALVMALALLLAGPYWARPGGGKKGWVLVDTGVIAAYGGRVDSLVKMGWEKHVLEGMDYWRAFRTADGMAPGGVEFYIFSSGLAGRFMGERPHTNRVVHWDIYAPGDSVFQWTEKAWSVAADSARVMTGVTRATGSMYRYETVAMKSDTSTLYYTIYTDEAYKQDGRYLEAALRAVQEFTHRRLRPGPGGWLFWLSSKPLPVVTGFSAIWQYGTGKEKKEDTWMESTALYKETTGQERGGEAVWKDGYGRGVLVREGQTFHFYSRLNPDWGELVWSRQFPALLARMLFGEEGPGTRDLRMIDAAQLTPVRRRGGAESVDGFGETEVEGVRAPGANGAIDLGPASWILIFLLFILERWLSGKE